MEIKSCQRATNKQAAVGFRLCQSPARVRPMGTGGAGLANERWRVRFESEAGRRAEGAARRAGPGQVMAGPGGLRVPGRDWGVLGEALRAQRNLGSPAMCSLRGPEGRSRLAGGWQPCCFSELGWEQPEALAGKGLRGQSWGDPTQRGLGCARQSAPTPGARLQTVESSFYSVSICFKRSDISSSSSIFSLFRLKEP